jgi:hypothetical protein
VAAEDRDGRVAFPLGGAESARALTEEALSALGESDPYLEARLLGHLVSPAGQLHDAELTRALGRARDLVSEYRFPDVHAQIVAAEATRAWREGLFEEGVRLHREAHERFDRLGRTREALGEFYTYAQDFSRLGNLAAARQLIEEAISRARPYHIRWYEENGDALLAAIMLVRCELEAFDTTAVQLAAHTTFMSWGCKTHAARRYS